MDAYQACDKGTLLSMLLRKELRTSALRDSALRKELRDSALRDSALRTHTRVKLLCNWTDSKGLADSWNRMSKGNYSWGNILLVWEEPVE